MFSKQIITTSVLSRFIYMRNLTHSTNIITILELYGLAQGLRRAYLTYMYMYVCTLSFVAKYQMPFYTRLSLYVLVCCLSNLSPLQCYRLRASLVPRLLREMAWNTLLVLGYNILFSLCKLTHTLCAYLVRVGHMDVCRRLS